MGLATGNVLDRYVIEGLLGSGSMGRVYRATDTRLRRSVALKVLEVPASDVETEVALREARAAAAIVHPNVTAIFDADHNGGTSFIVMELVPGTPLRQLVGDASVPLTTRIRWLLEIAAALSAAHQAGVVHRDVKPENVIVREDGMVKVLDFGIARFASAATPALGMHLLGGSIAQTGLAGTPAYMAPEQIQGAAVDGRADQFAWGVVAYEILSGKLPWTSTSGPFGVLGSIMNDTPLPLPDDVPADVAAVVMRALSKSRDARFPSIVEAATALAPHSSGPLPLLGLAPDSSTRARAREARPPVRDPVSQPPPSRTRIAPLAYSVSPPPREPAPREPTPLGTEPPPSLRAPDTMATISTGSAIGTGTISTGSAISTGTISTGSAISTGTISTGSAISTGGTIGIGGAISTSAISTGNTIGTASTNGATVARPPVLRDPDFLAPIDLDAHLALLPSGAACKGLFLADMMRLIPRGRTTAEVHQLAGVPERRYIAFRDYPMTDHLRLTIAVARSAYPGVPLGQALRRLGQVAFDTVMGCHIGKTLFGILGKDLERLLLHWPKSYELFFGFGHITMQRSGPGLFSMHVRQFPVFLETHQVGILEGALRHCGATGRVRVMTTSPAEAVLEIDLV